MSHNLEIQRKRAVQYITGRVKPWALIFAVIVCAVCFILASASVTPQKYEINEGDIASATITAPRDITDRVTTEERQKKAQDEVRPIYKLDKQVTDASLQNITGYFDHAESVRAYCENQYLNDMLSVSGDMDLSKAKAFDPGEIKWNDFLTGETLEKLKTKLTPPFTDEEIRMIASIKKEDLETLQKDVLLISGDELNIGIQEENMADQVTRLTNQLISKITYTESMRKISAGALELLKPNMFYDSASTEAEKNLAAESVSPAIYKKGQNIVQAGEVVTNVQIEVLRDLGILKENTINLSLYIGVFIYVLLCFTFFGMYTLIFNKELIKSIKYVLLTGIIIIITVAVSIPLNRLDTRIITVYLGAFLACILISPKSAVGITVLLSFLTGLISASGEGIISERMAITVLCGISGGFTAILFLRKAHHRTEYIYSGIAAGLINAVVFAMVALLKGSGFNTVLSDGMWAMINGTASAIIAIGALPVLESMFRVATATRLLEILNPNQPLLKKLSLETPGTYHHSIIAANLSEAAAEALHLNTLLVKASAYYHDIGKLKKPEMYKENQQGRENPHEHMDPKKSAVILREHVIFGKYLAVKHKLPKDMTDMIEQHHGTMVMQYFYSKAKEVFPDIKTDDYRYKGPKPQTKEALILMLADCTEAAVRASGSSQKEKIREIIEKLIKERGEDKQFDECDITQKDLAAIKDAFINVYQGMYHERIQYPEVINDAENHTGL